MEKTTTIVLDFDSLNDFEGQVTLTRKGRVETTVFELGRKENKNVRGESDLRFHFKGGRSQLEELRTFIETMLSTSYDELHPEEAKREKAMKERALTFDDLNTDQKKAAR